MPLYPDIEVNIINAGSNPLVLVGRLKIALEQGGIDPPIVKKLVEEAFAKGTVDGIIKFLFDKVSVIDTLSDKEKSLIKKGARVYDFDELL